MATTQLKTDRYDDSRKLVSLTPEGGNAPVHIAIDGIATHITGEQLGDLVCNFVNSFGNLDSAERMSAAIQQSHRTLQASAIRFMLETLLAYDPGTYIDARNEGAKAVCDRLRRIQNEFPADLFVPFI